MAEWWINNSGTNTLKGVVDDADNPPILTDGQIIDFLRRIPAARDSFNVLVPTMTGGERTRLEGLAAHAFYAQPDLQAKDDDFQTTMNRQGVRTSGPMGGRRYGGNL